MSARYVYDIYNTSVAQDQQTTEETLKTSSDYSYAGAIVCNNYTMSVTYNRKGEPITKYSPGEDSRLIAGVSFNGSGGGNTPNAEDTAKYRYIIFYLGTGVFDFSSGDIIFSQCYLLSFSPSVSGAFWHTLSDAKNKSLTVWNNNNGNQQSIISGQMPFYKSGGEIRKGSSILSNQSANSKVLKEGPIVYGSTWRWRVYRGSDNIDPVSVTYSKTDLQQNEPVEVRVTPRAPTYGGTVYYQYAYSIDGGRTWKNIGSRTTEISVTITVPEGAAQFQARVTASDSWGFTSTTPVLGQNLEVSQLKAYAAVSGINRAGVKMYVTVGGKIREVQKGYAMVGGKVRKLF